VVENLQSGFKTMKEQRTKKIIIFEFKEKILVKKETVFLGKIVEDVDRENEFKRIDTKMPFYDNLDSGKKYCL